MDYVKERASHHELLKRVHIWERKLEIVEVILLKHYKIVDSVLILDDTSHLSTNLETVVKTNSTFTSERNIISLYSIYTLYIDNKN